MRKKTIKALLMTMAVLSIIFISSMTASASAAIKNIEYEGNGKVEVNFKSGVKYNHVKIAVKDAAGKIVKAVITDIDHDDLDFRLKHFSMGKTYRFTISGIKKTGESKFGTVKGSVRIPVTKGSVPVRKIEYDRGDNEVEFDFAVNVKWNAPKVSIFSGKTQYVQRIDEKDRKGIEVKVRKLIKGKIYKYKISGIRKAGDKKYTTISGSFTA